MTPALLLAAVAQTIVPAPVYPQSETEPCAPFAESARTDPTPRPMTVEDLTKIADIGPAIAEQTPSAFGLSSAGDRIAFMVKRANPQANAYCQRLLVAPVRAAGDAIEISKGGGYLHDDFRLRDFSVVLAGWDKPNPPRWSPDGTRIAYLRREGNSTQVWIVDPAGATPPGQATHLPDDVDDFRWTPSGTSLVVATRPGIRAAAQTIAAEGARGFLFDDRFSPQFAGHPIPTGPVESEYTLVSLADGAARPATGEERELLDLSVPREVPASARNFQRGPDGNRAWLEPKEPDHLLSPTRVVISRPDGRHRVCASADCEGVFGLWWSKGDDALILQQRTGWARSQTALLRWDKGASAPRPFLLTDDLLIGCQLHRGELICAREGATQPRRLVAIDTSTGTERVIYDPNPHLRHMRRGPVRRLRFHNSYGVESFADLILPPGHEEGQRHPLVVVQYTSRGFLRGGTGDEVPIQPLAAHGFAVLSFDRPGPLPAAYRARNEIETRTLIADPWADRRQVQSSLETAVELSIATGTVDPERIGISGFSDGAATVQFALINSDLFDVASVGTCCADKIAQPLAAGPRFTDYFRAMGYPFFEEGGEAFWKPISMLENVDTIEAPILIQAADSEYEGGLDVVETFTNRGKALELFVFPGETHYKWQPAHRKAVYERNVDWFEFWLAGKMDCAPSKAEQYRRWLAMPDAPKRDDLQCSNDPSAGP